jgi:hypothetical protein
MHLCGQSIAVCVYPVKILAAGRRADKYSSPVNVPILNISILIKKRKHATREMLLHGEYVTCEQAFVRLHHVCSAPAGWHASTLPAIQHKPNNDLPMRGC